MRPRPNDMPCISTLSDRYNPSSFSHSHPSCSTSEASCRCPCDQTFCYCQRQRPPRRPRPARLHPPRKRTRGRLCCRSHGRARWARGRRKMRLGFGIEGERHRAVSAKSSSASSRCEYKRDPATLLTSSTVPSPLTIKSSTGPP